MDGQSQNSLNDDNGIKDLSGGEMPLEDLVSVIAPEIYPDFLELEKGEQEARIKKGVSVVRDGGILCVRQETSELFRGPLPPPNILAGYEDIVPGCAKQIIDDMLNESLHRRAMEDKSLNSAIIYTKDGLKKGFIISLVGLIGGCIIVIGGIAIGGTGATVASVISGTLISGGSIVSIVSKLVDGKQSAKEKAKSDIKPTKQEEKK